MKTELRELAEVDRQARRQDCEMVTDGPVDETEEDREWVKSERARLIAEMEAGRLCEQ